MDFGLKNIFQKNKHYHFNTVHEAILTFHTVEITCLLLTVRVQHLNTAVFPHAWFSQLTFEPRVVHILRLSGAWYLRCWCAVEVSRKTVKL